MSDLNVYVVVAALVGILVFLRLGVTWKVLAAFFVMGQCFNLAPQIMFGYFVWDVGAIMLLIAGAQLMLAKPKEPKIRAFTLTVLWAFFIWLLVCLAYSLLVDGLPVLNTLKISRQMIIGYLSIFIFLRLFRVDRNALPTFIKWLYIATYLLLIVAIIQYGIGKPIMPGLTDDYGAAILYRDALRYLPVYLPVSLFYLWIILSKYFQGESIKFHELVYGVMVAVIVALTFTRGIYFAVFDVFMALLFLLQSRGRLKTTPVVIFFVLASLSLTILVAGGWADRVVGRVGSGLDIVLDNRGKSSKVDEDTFTGRLLLVKERIGLVAERNPLVGFGFMHEDDLPGTVRAKFKYGSVISTPEMLEKYRHGHPYVLQLYSVDIGWASIVLHSGFVGSFLFLLFAGTFVFGYKKIKHDSPPFFHYRIAFFLQTVTLLLLMFNGSPFTDGVQFSALMIAGYYYCSGSRRVEAREHAGSSSSKDDKEHVA